MPAKQRLDCFVAALAMTFKYAFAIPRRDTPESCLNLSPLEGVGNAGCPLHPQPRVRFALVEKHTSKRVHRSNPAFPHAMVLTVSFVLPGDRACLPPSSADMFLSKPGWADLNSANLTPASGRRDHTTSPSAATSFVSVLLIARGFKRTRPAIPSRANRCRVHRIPPRVRDDRDTPRQRGGMARVVDVIWVSGNGKISRNVTRQGNQN
jgi:hypothetical protein